MAPEHIVKALEPSSWQIPFGAPLDMLASMKRILR